MPYQLVVGTHDVAVKIARRAHFRQWFGGDQFSNPVFLGRTGRVVVPCGNCGGAAGASAARFSRQALQSVDEFGRFVHVEILGCPFWFRFHCIVFRNKILRVRTDRARISGREPAVDIR